MARLIEIAGQDWPTPHHATLCRRQARIAVEIPYRHSEVPPNLLIDIEPWNPTGPSNHGEAASVSAAMASGFAQAWRDAQARMAEGSSDHGHFGWCHRAVEFTSSKQGNSQPGGATIKTVSADGADDTRRCHAAILEHSEEHFGYS